VDILRWAKARGIDVTAEVTPHHLALTENEAVSYNPVFKVNPPLRGERDREAVRAALADGTIDAVATDHAPHPAEAKDVEWQAAAFGMTGLETALSVVVDTMVNTGLLDWEGVADRMSIAPARIARLAGHGRPIEVGEPANLAIVDPTASRIVDAADTASRSRNTPFAGRELPARVVATFLRGRPTLLDGVLVPPNGGTE
jgi:dihydroorotase